MHPLEHHVLLKLTQKLSLKSAKIHLWKPQSVQIYNLSVASKPQTQNFILDRRILKMGANGKSVYGSSYSRP